MVSWCVLDLLPHPTQVGCRGWGLPVSPRNMLLEGAPAHDLDHFWWLGLVTVLPTPRSNGFKDLAELGLGELPGPSALEPGRPAGAPQSTVFASWVFTWGKIYCSGDVETNSEAPPPWAAEGHDGRSGSGWASTSHPLRLARGEGQPGPCGLWTPLAFPQDTPP